MARLPRLPIPAPAILLSLALAACGGGSSDQPVLTLEPAMATAGFERFNENRQLMGLSPITRSREIDIAAQGHSKYQARNNVITHDQTPGNPGFTGANLEGRLSQARYNLVPSYAIGEVIAKTGYTDGATAADALITAIYHRFVIFEPTYKEAGAGATGVANGYTYFTTDFAASNGLGIGLTPGKVVTYPYDAQQSVPTSFDHSSEEPDAFPKAQFPEFTGVIVGYPISVHADINQLISNVNFNVRRRDDGTTLAARLLDSRSDPQTPTSGAAIIPLERLNSGATYDVAFSGSICTISTFSPPNTACISAVTAISQNWSFTTK